MRKIIIVSAFTCVFGVAYFLLDKDLSHYGQSDFDIYNTLPLKIEPEFRYEFEGGFRLEDEFGFSLISTGPCQYVNSQIKLNVKEFVKYGYNNNKLIGLVKDSRDKEYFIECLPQKNSQSNQDMVINVIDANSHIDNGQYKWVDVRNMEIHTKRYRQLRAISLIFVVVSLIFWGWFGIKGK